jgi:hypothetical protein
MVFTIKTDGGKTDNSKLKFDYDQFLFSTSPSKVVGRNGVGALVDINGTSMLICDSKDWYNPKFEDKYSIEEPRLRAALHATGFLRVPDETDWDRISGKYFTSWYYQPSTRGLKRLRDWTEFLSSEERDAFYSKGPFAKGKGNRREKLYPMPQYLTCKRGHLTEFPFLEWCHHGSVCDQPNLLYNSEGTMPILQCTYCKARNQLPRTLERKEVFEYVHSCSGRMPWNKEDDWEQCSEAVIPMRKEESNSYFPNFYTSIKLPLKVENDISWQESEYMPAIIKAYTTGNDIKLDLLIDMLIEDYPKVLPETIKSFLSEDGGDAGEIQDVMEFKRAEYNVLNQQAELHEDEISKIEFQQRSLLLADSNESLLSIFETVSVLPRITTVKAAVDFARVEPQDMGNEFTMSLKRKDGKYIAVESRGEGIFFSFKTSWMEEHIKKFEDKFRFVHTMSHLLMKELGEVSGYPITSLSERLYIDDAPGQEMYGALIYTASGDKNGTLGGVVEQGILQNFTKNLKHALEHAQWCSFDPVCSHQEHDESTGNIAACHYCSYVPETSCETFNRKLDRNVILGTLIK